VGSHITSRPRLWERVAGVARGLRHPWPSRSTGRNIEDSTEEDTGTVLLEHLISNSLVVEYGSFDLKSWRLEGELHKGELVPSFKLLGLHLHVSLVDPERLAELNVGNEQGELAVKVQQENPEVLSDDDPMLGEGAGDPVLDGVLVDRSKVDVGSGALLLLWMEVWWWSLTKTCLPWQTLGRLGALSDSGEMVEPRGEGGGGEGGRW
jgi:hypothetical protein